MTEPRDIDEVIKAVQDDITTIVRGEVALVADEIKGEAAKAGIIAGLFGGAGYVAVSAIAVLFGALGFAWSVGYQAWFHLEVLPALFWGFFTMAVLMLLIAALLGFIGSRAPKPGPPTRSIDSAKDQVEFVKTAITEASAEIAARPLLRPRSTRAELD